MVFAAELESAVLKIACFKPCDHLTSPIVARVLRPHTHLTTQPWRWSRRDIDRPAYLAKV